MERARRSLPRAMFQNLNTVLRTLSVLALVTIGGWWTLHARQRILEHEQAIASRDERIERLSGDLEQREATIVRLDGELAESAERIQELGTELEAAEEQIQKLDLSLKLIKLDHRVARLEVLDQRPVEGRVDGDGEPVVETTVRFVELDGDGQPVGEPVEAVVEGTRVYIESLVIKFDDRYVEEGDWLRGTSVVLFKSLFGRDQKPSEGTPIDPHGTRPTVYGEGDGPAPLHAELWQRFWEYANDPDLARERGVRAMQGEAPFMELRKGKVYRVDLRSSGGLTIQSE